MSWTPGMLSALTEKEKAAEGKKGMAYVVARLEALNYLYCWSEDATAIRRREAGLESFSRWHMVNRHLWRIQALYHGGDCFLAGWPGAFPHQRLWAARTFGDQHALPAYRAPLKSEEDQS